MLPFRGINIRLGENNILIAVQSAPQSGTNFAELPTSVDPLSLASVSISVCQKFQNIDKGVGYELKALACLVPSQT